MARNYEKTWKAGSIISFFLCLFLFYFASSAFSSPPLHEDRSDIPEFDGASAFTLLYKQVEMGPRVPGTDSYTRAQDAYIAWFDSCGGIVREQDFTAEINRTQVKGKNIIAYFGPRSARSTFIIASSYDSAPICNEFIRKMLPDPSNTTSHNVSGVSVILELARLFAINPPEISVELVLFDLSVQIVDIFDEKDRGSDYYAINHSGKKPDVMIMLDNIGYQSYEIVMNELSWKYNIELVESVFDRAIEMDLPAFDKKTYPTFGEPPRALIKAGFPLCYLSHRNNPDLDISATCTSTSLQQVGDLLVNLIYRGSGE